LLFIIHISSHHKPIDFLTDLISELLVNGIKEKKEEEKEFL